jgi:hypothetical protein
VVRPSRLLGGSVGDGTRGRANTIAFNGKDGVLIKGSDLSTANSVLSNFIFSNGELGIDLSADGLTSNDAGDVDTGPNGLQNKPVLTFAKTVSGKTTIKGKLNSRPNKTYTLELFSNPSGNEGKKLIGEKSVRTDEFGNRSFTFTSAAVSVGKTVTAMATNTSGSKDTSEFSAPRKVAFS